jgi:hypothetical protein
MLNLPGCTSTERLNPPTTFSLFEHKNLVGTLDLTRKAQNQATSHPCKKLCMNNNAHENDSDSSTANTVQQLPLLLADDALAQAISQVKLQMDGWVLLDIYRLFVVLVKPPPGLNLNMITGMGGYLTQLLVEIGNLINNGILEIVCHCWWVLLSKCFTPSLPQL